MFCCGTAGFVFPAILHDINSKVVETHIWTELGNGEASWKKRQTQTPEGVGVVHLMNPRRNCELEGGDGRSVLGRRM